MVHRGIEPPNRASSVPERGAFPLRGPPTCCSQRCRAPWATVSDLGGMVSAVRQHSYFQRAEHLNLRMLAAPPRQNAALEQITVAVRLSPAEPTWSWDRPVEIALIVVVAIVLIERVAVA